MHDLSMFYDIYVLRIHLGANNPENCQQAYSVNLLFSKMLLLN